MQANQRVVDFLLSISAYDVAIVAAYAMVTLSLITLASFLLLRLDKHHSSSSYNSIAISLGFIMVALLMLPVALPYQALRLGGGLQNFNFVLYIFGRLMEITRNNFFSANGHAVQQSSSLTASKHSNQQSSADQLPYHKGDAMYSLFSMLSCYLYPHLVPNQHKHARSHKHTHAPPPRLTALLAELIWLLILFDTALYVIQEFLPHVYTSTLPPNPSVSKVAFLPSFHPASPSSLHFYTAMWSAAFDMICMHLVYILAQFVCVCLFSHHIPAHIMHTTPALSHSVSEFWKVRWNPCTSKLLQYAFYKHTISYLHTHYAHMPKAQMQLLTVCVVFIGSGLLHAYPIYIATRSVYDALCMGGFFVIQIVFIVAESIVDKLMSGKQAQSNSPLPPSPMIDTNSSALIRNKCAEYLVIGSVLCVIHIVHDGLFTPMRTSVLIVVVTSNVYIMYRLYETYVNTSSARSLSPSSSPKPTQRAVPKSATVLYYVCGWLYAISTLTYFIPLFSMPMHHALGHVYARSYVVGPFLKTLADLWQISYF